MKKISSEYFDINFLDYVLIIFYRKKIYLLFEIFLIDKIERSCVLLENFVIRYFWLGCGR